MPGQLLEEFDTVHAAGSIRGRIVVPHAWLADPRDSVQYRVARRVGVGIGAGFQQVSCQFEVRVGRRQQQRRGAEAGRSEVASRLAENSLRRPYRIVHVRARIEQHPNHAGPSFPRGKQ